MNIAINCRSILKQNSTGIGRYTYQLINSLGIVDRVNAYHLYASKRLFDFKRKLPHFSYKNFYRHHDFLNRGMERTVGKVDVCHIPSPEYVKTKRSPLVVTVHDLIFKTYPQSHPQQAIDMLEEQMSSIVKNADHIICISESTRNDLHRFYNFPKERSSVIYNGVNHQMFYPVSDQEKDNVQATLASHGIDKPYFLYVGTIEPRKNLHGILKALKQLQSMTNFDGYLVVVGMKGWMVENIEPMIKQLNLAERVKFLGFVPDDHLRILYNKSEAFLFPSFYEGFGFPIIEAFASKVPVITSNTSSCAEIAQEAAITISPDNSDELSKAMQRVLSDKAFCQALMTRGINRAHQFAFDQTARETVNIYKQVKG